MLTSEDEQKARVMLLLSRVIPPLLCAFAVPLKNTLKKHYITRSFSTFRRYMTERSAHVMNHLFRLDTKKVSVSLWIPLDDKKIWYWGTSVDINDRQNIKKHLSERCHSWFGRWNYPINLKSLPKCRAGTKHDQSDHTFSLRFFVTTL